MRLVTVAFVVAMLTAGSAQAQTAALPSAQTPNGPGSIVVPFSLSSPPQAPEQRSYAQLLELWKSAGAAYGVPWEVLGAINKIESNFGRNMGPSSAGAAGWMQFMPSTWDRWGVDADGDGVANPWVPEDAIYAAARYLAASGAAEDISRAIFSYNHADWYVRDVLELAQVFAGGGGFDPSLVAGGLGLSGGPHAVFQLDDLEERLDDVRRTVNAEQRMVRKAEARVQRLDTAVLAAQQRAGNPNLTDQEFERIEEQVTSVVLRHEAALDALAAARGGLDEAVAALNALRQEAEARASTVTFTTDAITSPLGAAQFSGGYVFPVGGGPSVVSVGRDHHDYPAADIVAPEGSPLYALADAIVLKTYPEPSGRCGIGFQLQLADGKSYVYCHLSYLEPSVVAGATLAAGAPVGLVGSTGNSTGPHLHLQFIPTEAYPQNESWFQSFAGVAFSWDGQPPSPAPALDGGRVITFSR